MFQNHVEATFFRQYLLLTRNLDFMKWPYALKFCFISMVILNHGLHFYWMQRSEPTEIEVENGFRFVQLSFQFF